MKRVPSDTYEARLAANTRRTAEVAVRRRLDALLLAPDVAERVVDSLSKFVAAPVFWILNLVVVAWWLIINSEIIPGMAAFDPTFFKLLYFLVPCEALVLVIIVGLNRHYLTRKTERLNQLQRLLRKLDDEVD